MVGTTTHQVDGVFCLKEAGQKNSITPKQTRGIYLVAISIISECAKGENRSAK